MNGQSAMLPTGVLARCAAYLLRTWCLHSCLAMLLSPIAILLVVQRLVREMSNDQASLTCPSRIRHVWHKADRALAQAYTSFSSSDI